MREAREASGGGDGVNCIKCVRGDRPHTTHYGCDECADGNHWECTVRYGCCCGCAQCGKAFTRKAQKKYCSRECQWASMCKPKPPCGNCGEPVKKHGSKFCSKACFKTAMPNGRWPAKNPARETLQRAAYCLAERDTPASCFIVAQHKAGEAMPVYNEHTEQGRFLLYADKDAELWQDFVADMVEGTYLIGSKKAVVLC